MGCDYRLAGDVACQYPGAEVRRVCLPGMEMAELTLSTHREVFLSARLEGGETLAGLLGRIADRLRAGQARMISLEIFGVSGHDGEAALRAAFGAPTFPVTWIEEGCEEAAPRVGVELWAAAGLTVTPLRLAGRVIGSVLEDECVRVCRLGGLAADDLALPAPEQARAVLGQMTNALAQAGMDFSHVVRTWFYNRRMLDWYDSFNAERTAFFKRHNVFGGLVPASTGVGGRNARGGALTAGVLAIAPRCAAVRAFAVPSPLQCPALEYGSAFSRAVEITLPGLRRLLISGTASIAPEGRTEHVDDAPGQVALTMDVAAAILKSRGMGWGDVSRAIAYFKRLQDAPLFEEYRLAHGLPPFPRIVVKEDICRHDLLFEIELDAVKK